MRLTLCRPGVPGIHMWRAVPIVRHIGGYIHRARLITVGHTYQCERCNERGYAA